MIRLVLFFFLIVLGCTESKKPSEKISPEEINSILGQFQESDAIFTEKGVAFDSILTLAGTRLRDGIDERIKMKLFFYGPHCRGYFNLPLTDDKNLQVFGKNIDNQWILKCVTKLNMEEVGGYMLIEQKKSIYQGIWSNGHVNFKNEKIRLVKNSTDYNILTDW